MSAAHVVLGLAVVATVAGGAASCDTGTPTTPAGTGHGNYRTCQTGWVCGTCPNGDWWGYLNDPTYTNDPTVNHALFDNRHPCGGS